MAVIHLVYPQSAGQPVDVGNAISGSYGSFTINSNGSYSYAINNADSAVQTLNVGQTLIDTINYTMRDANRCSEQIKFSYNDYGYE